MNSLSIIELCVIGGIAYSSFIFAVVSVIKEIPTGRKASAPRLVFIIPGLICAAILASAGVSSISVDSTSSYQTIKNYNVTANKLTTNSTVTSTITKTIPLTSNVFMMINLIVFFSLVIFLLFQFGFILTSDD